ncbi:hypothetical protein [Facilibium subflavum]|uniref:hypothetical protein n=1 Tax=Facilibium subflavum TaxID=2219058 RepID=UPI000E65193E|nr:hypothetical protein [Facilibium subflavum]
MRKGILATSIAITLGLTGVVHAGGTSNENITVTQQDVRQSLQDFSDKSLSGSPESIKQLKAFYNAADQKSYLQMVATGISLADLTIKDYSAYKQDKQVNIVINQSKESIQALYAAAQNINEIPEMDRHLGEYKTAFDKAWQARVAFWENQDSSEKAQDFNHLTNYMTIYGISSIEKKGLEHAKNTYVHINEMAYQLQVDTQNAYKQVKKQTIDNLYNVSPEILKSNITLLRENATIKGVTQAVVDLNQALEQILNVNQPVKVFGVTIFTLKIPQKVKDAVHRFEEKSGTKDSYEALLFMMRADINQITSYQFIQQAADKNSFAKAIVSISNVVAEHFKVPQEQAYWALMNQIAVQFSKNIQ